MRHARAVPLSPASPELSASARFAAGNCDATGVTDSTDRPTPTGTPASQIVNEDRQSRSSMSRSISGWSISDTPSITCDASVPVPSHERSRQMSVISAFAARLAVAILTGNTYR